MIKLYKGFYKIHVKTFGKNPNWFIEKTKRGGMAGDAIIDIPRGFRVSSIEKGRYGIGRGKSVLISIRKVI
jgi:hypothetical protein